MSHPDVDSPAPPDVAGQEGPGKTGPRANNRSAAFAEERHARILELVEERGRIRNVELAELLNVTEPTVRKDVTDLARRRLLHRTHGGVIATRPALEPDMPARVMHNVDAKTRIAAACLQLVSPGDAVFLDGGSTVLRLAQLLVVQVQQPASRWNVNVLTNALGVTQTLADHFGVRHTLLGGTYRPAGDCTLGPLTLADLEQFTLNVAFLGVTGLSEQGFTVADLGEAQVKKAVVDRARRVVVAMDHSKLGAVDFAKVCDLDAVSTVVTDAVSDYLTDSCAHAGVELIVAD